MFGDGRCGTVHGVSTAAPRLPHLRRLDDLMQKFGVVPWQKDLNASDAPIFVGSTLLATIRAPRSAKETAMQIDAGTLRRALKNLVQLGPMQPKRPMLEHVCRSS